MHADQSGGRLHPEPESAFRSPYQRDRDRIIHSTAFRRLEYKTQVFVNHEGDHFRTRLTHSLEVAQISRTISRVLGLDEDLAEAVALAHDLGHTPFGHTGEDALDEVLEGHGGFDHNIQTFRIVTRLERRYAEFDGLNLTFETLECIAKHNGPVGPELPAAYAAFEAVERLALECYAPLEAQVASLSDDIAYLGHDVDDGLRAGLFTLDDLKALPLVGAAVRDVDFRHGNLETQRRIHETVRRFIDAMVSDIVTESRRLIAAADPRSVDDVRAQGKPLLAFSPSTRSALDAVRSFLHERMYSHYKVNRMRRKAHQVVCDLFEIFVNEPGRLPEDWRRRAGEPQSPRTISIVRDYIAGMTDRYAQIEHARLSGVEDPTS